MPDQTPDPTDLELLREASQRLVRTVDALDDDDWAAPSLLPGWTRAHVVAHLLLNAEGLAGALRGLATAEPLPMYPSQERRDADIDALVEAGDHTELRDRLLASTTELADAVDILPGDRWDAGIERVPGGPSFPARDVPTMRWREIEVHHADLGTGYSPADWQDGVAARILDDMPGGDRAERPFRVHATDLDRGWAFGDGGPTVSGRAADLAWWLTGRGDGTGLTSDDGELPGIEAW